MLLFAPLFIGLALTIDPFLNVFFGDKWDDAVVVIQALILVTVLSHTRIYIPTLLTSLGTPQSTVFIDAISTVVALFACYLLFDEFGVLAAVIAQFVRVAFNYPFLSRQLKMRLDISLYESNKVYFSALFACALMVMSNLAMLHSLNISPLESLLLSIGVGGGIYVTTIAVLEIRFIKRMIYKA